MTYKSSSTTCSVGDDSNSDVFLHVVRSDDVINQDSYARYIKRVKKTSRLKRGDEVRTRLINVSTVNISKPPRCPSVIPTGNERPRDT